MIGHRAEAALIRTGLALVVVLSAMVVAAAPVGAGYPGANGRLVFSSTRGPGTGSNLFTSDVDGSNVTQITFGSSWDADPTWSPGGQRIAFTRYANDTLTNGDIWVIDKDGTDARRLTTYPGTDYRPTWSPDAERIAFTSDRADGNADLWIMNWDGSNLRRRTSGPGAELEPSWNPQDLNEIMFVWYELGNPSNGKIARLPANTGAIECCDSAPGGVYHDRYPDWAPSGDNFTFMRLTCGAESCDSAIAVGPEPPDIVADAGGGEVDEHPAWSPDGTRIFFDTTRDDPNPSDETPIFDIFHVGPSGGAPVAVTNNTSSIAWNPDVQPIPDFPLVDARFSSFYESIVWVFEAGITTGCDVERFCHKAPVTRGQMAAFLSRALDLPDATDDYFTDDETSTFEASINKVREAEIAFGCTATTYCPTAPVTRGQMAAFLSRALTLPPATDDYFTDDEGSTFEDSINRVREAEIAFGCTETTYCPSNTVTRGQMAAFLFRALAP